MARPLRLELAGGLYHVTSRGDRQEDIYTDDADREKWLEILGSVCSRFNWRCHAYCQMDNHYHIVVETAEANLSKGMRQLNGVYTQYYNHQHKRVGHVYQGRYKGILVERDTYLLELSRYVVLNPVRAHMIKTIEDWKWSSYQAMIGDVPARPWIETDWILGNFAKRRKIAVAKYIDFVREGVGLPSLWSDLKNQIFLGTEKFVNKKQKLINKKESLGEVPRLHRRKIPKSLEYYERKYKNQKKAICNAYLSGGYTLKEIGDHFQKHYSTVSRIVKRNE
jgi:putative transposase